MFDMRGASGRGNLFLRSLRCQQTINYDRTQGQRLRNWSLRPGSRIADHSGVRQEHLRSKCQWLDHVGIRYAALSCIRRKEDEHREGTND